MADKGKFPHWISGLDFSLRQERGYQEKEFPRNRKAGCQVSVGVADQDCTVSCGIRRLEFSFNRKNGKRLTAFIQMLISRFFFKDIESPFKNAAAAAAKSLQSCPTLHDPMDSSLPGSSVHGIFQAKVLKWVAIACSAQWT